MTGSDIVAGALMLVFCAGFIYFSFVFPARQKKESGEEMVNPIAIEESAENPVEKGKKTKNAKRRK